MELRSGDRVQVESESTERPPRTGLIEEVLRGAHSPRCRISWDDGHESIHPGGGALHFRRADREGVGPKTRRQTDSRKRSRAR
jgi:hypothetical protein